MNSLCAVLLTLPAIAMIASAVVPQPFAARRISGYRRWITLLAVSQWVIAVVFAVACAFGSLGPIDVSLISAVNGELVSFGVYYDGTAALMLALVSFVGWVICRYSIRYLDGDAGQSRYFRWTGLTIGAVSLLVISGNLIMFAACWLMTSLGLHQLLLHYGDRVPAQRAAWTKFTISRLGDVALVGAIVLTYTHFKTLHFGELFDAAGSLSNPQMLASTPGISVAAFLFVIAGITKSAQFPLHTWLPQTMETPTPVSALMHAGIVNAGGYMIIRISPLLVGTPAALTVLAMVGAVTACFGATVMLTQTSVKKSLAYSTIAQMGFMMLQCGLGAFSAAMLHILAHSLYKAHAFLSSGSVMSQRSSMLGAKPPIYQVSWTKIASTAVGLFLFFTVMMNLTGTNLTSKPGGFLLGGLLCVALTQWLAQVMAVGGSKLMIRSYSTAGLLCVAYAISFAAVDTIVHATVPEVANTSLAWSVTLVVVIGFAAMLALQANLKSDKAPGWLHHWYVHASNGFYVDSLLRRVFGPLKSI